MLTRFQHALSGRRTRQPDQATIDAVRQLLEHEAAAAERALPHTDLTANHIRNLRVAIDREALMAWMPKNSIAAEIGVGAGDFTAVILEQATPLKLYLIDSWTHDERYVNLGDQVANWFRPKPLRPDRNPSGPFPH